WRNIILLLICAVKQYTFYFLKTSCPCCTEQVSAVMCDDGESECPEGTTCCETPDGSWGCCPMPKAVCCSDGNHCCPTNYTCDVNSTTCVKGEVVIPWYTKLPAVTSDEDYGNSVECDARNKCPEGSTCCQLAGGQWGCCPLEKVCTDYFNATILT
uniref:Granulins domain-containing protein n=1 Tax=Myripristis murdjan TaxID=586833 RepID=A0A667Z4V6_9TELE